ncbi:putative lipoprotein [Streptomyces formicae]|uniref:Putative lipoprotein n=2 Tax=Streptomyces formicae TaxID=1616117 RepID=A0A291Q8D4_9ACTN|nr:putative lipoprotein [Streptomyces formicae]
MDRWPHAVYRPGVRSGTLPPMGALRRLSGTYSLKRRSPVLYAVALAGAAAIGVTACDPVDGQLNTSAVALTTDEMGTKELERQHADVSWLSCTGRFEGRVTPQSGKPTKKAVVKVDCQGETDDGKDITIKGRVHAVVDGACVRGNLTAKIDGKQWFSVDVLGNCDSGDDNGDGNGNGGNGNGNGGHDGGGKPSNPPVSHQPPPSHHKPQPAPTTTVTVTATAPPPQPTCNCLPGK